MRLLYILIILLNFQYLSAQDSYFQALHLTETDGLPPSNIKTGFQCSRGFIWIIPFHGGLLRYDGVSIKTYTKQENGVPDNFIILGAEAPDKMLWLAESLLGETSLSIKIFNPLTERAITIDSFFKNSLPFDSKKLIKLQKNQDGTLWLITLDHKIYEFNGKNIYLWGKLPQQEFKEYTDKICKLSDSLFCTTEQNQRFQGVIFANNSGDILKKEAIEGLGLLDLMPWTKKTHTATVALIYDKGKERTPLKFLAKVSLKKPIFILDSLQNDLTPYYMSNDSLIFKLGSVALQVYNKFTNEWTNYPMFPMLTLRFIDNQGGLWFSDEQASLINIRKKHSNFKHYPLDSTYRSATRGILEDSIHGLFITHGDALVHRIKGKEHLIYKGTEKYYGDLFGLCLQKDGKALWLADGHNIWKVNPQNPSEQVLYHKGSRNDFSVTVFWQPYEDKFGTIWLGSSNGLYYLNQDDSLIYPYKESNTNSSFDLKTSSVFSFYENAKGLWLCTSKGLFLLDYHKGILEQYFPNLIIPHFYEDSDQTFWLATKGSGLVHWQPTMNKKEYYTTQEGLSNNVIYAVYPDDYGQLWMSSNYGLMRFDKKTKEVIVFLEENGIPNLEFNTVSHFRSKDGKLFFGGLEGAISFYPKDFLNTKSPYHIQITDFQKQNYNDEFSSNNYATLIQNKTITLYPTDKAFQLSFALLNLDNSKHNKYAYKIEGYDNNWQPLQKPTIKINTLPYGNYKLRLKAQTSGKKWQEANFVITIQVLPPFYLQWWFIILSISLLIILMFSIIKWRELSLLKEKEKLEFIVQERTAEIAQQAEELKALDKIKSKFFANVSHELRTPLTLILGPVANLREKPRGMLTEEKVRSSLELIERNGKNLLVLIDELLELPKLESGKGTVEEMAINFKHYIYRIFSSFKSLAAIQEIDYKIVYNLNGSPNLLIDKAKVSKIINNFLNNAFKFTAPKGEVILSISATATTFSITVKDTGKGIHPDDLPHVFKRFYQSKTPDNEAQGGTGIGLALCSELATILKGKVWVESTLGKGSCFGVELPLKIAKSTDINTELTPVVNATNTPNLVEETWIPIPKTNTLLLVEDNVDMRTYISSLLSDNYNIIIAKNGQEGLDQLTSNYNKIDLVLSDVMMPLMDGFTMLKTIKANDTWRNLPVIMLTARAAEKDKLNALTIGVDDYLIKPFSTKELQVRIQNLLQNYHARKLWKQELTATKEPSKPEPKTILQESKIPTKVEKEDLTVSLEDLEWIKKVEEEIKIQLNDQDFDVATLAKKMFLSKRQLERRILKITGYSPAKLTKEVRLQTARDLLESGSFDNIADVSFAVGIQTPNYFSKLYSQRFGKAPKDYF